jgi:hypothetical protein
MGRIERGNVMILRLVGGLILALVVLVAGFLVYVRVAPSDVATWHQDPLTAPTPETPNSFRVLAPGSSPGPEEMVSPVFPVPPAALMAAFDRMAMAQERTERLAGTPDGDGFVTYVQRTPTVGYPDYVSVRAVPAGDGGSALVILSRSRFGKSDLGVNKARITDWLAKLDVPPASTPVPQPESVPESVPEPAPEPVPAS